MRKANVVAAAPARQGIVHSDSIRRVLGTLAGALAVAAVAVTALVPPALAARTPGSTSFPRYKELEPNVAFWSAVFTKWTSRQVAFHDVEHLDLVYSVLSISDIFERLPVSQVDGAIRARRKAEGERLSAMLVRISNGQARTEEERRILKAIARIGHEPSYARKLSEQVRSQRGLGDKFCEAAERAEAYRPMMTPILDSYGVPRELLALPLVESGYKVGAYSTAAASGIWQFIPSTGRLYLTINNSYDDRRDPVRSTEAAARMLSKLHENMGSWPLAITSYNHGPGGVARAVKEMGTTHFGVISRHYKGRAFGFASRNYYAEFLAAVDAMQSIDKLCGRITVAPYAPDEVKLTSSAGISTLAKAAGTSVTALGELNPALSSSVRQGRSQVPRGYRLNIPGGTREQFARSFGHIDRAAPRAPTMVAKAGGSSTSKPASASVTTATRSHRVQKGETLSHIARRYGTTETTLMWMNKLRSARSLQAGNTIQVPDNRATAPVVVAKAAGEAAAKAAGATMAAVPAAVVQTRPTASKAADSDPVLTTEHKVGRGQTLTQIASMYRTSVGEIKTMNGISDARKVQAGQVLKVRTSGSQLVGGSTVGRTYKAQSGDTLWSLARSNDTSVETLKRLNPKVANRGLKVGDKIKIPSNGAVSVASAAAARPSYTSHRITSGQTLSSIAVRYGTSVATLKSINGIKDASHVRSGRTIKVPTGGSVAVASAKPSYGNHRIEKGQTLSAIAQRYNTSVDTLKRINGIRDARRVQAGKTIKVPL